MAAAALVRDLAIIRYKSEKVSKMVQNGPAIRQTGMSSASKRSKRFCQSKGTPNDADRLRKYLARYELDWRRLREQVSGV